MSTPGLKDFTTTEEEPKMQKFKIPAVPYPSDDCIVYIGRVVEDGEVVDQGVEYRVHEGETVSVIPAISTAEIIALGSMESVSDAGGAAAISEAFSDLCLRLSKRVVSWDWTDLAGEPYPQPYKNREVLMELTTDELIWLIARTTNRETPEERKND